MKNLSLVIMAVAIGIAVVCSSCIIAITPIVGNGNIRTSERTVSSFNKIHISGSAEVRFHESQEYRASVTVDSNLDEYVEVYVSGNVPNIRTRNGYFCSFTKLLVDVYCPVLTRVSMSGSGYFEGADTITTPVFAADISGNGKISGRIECESFSAKISGSGKINVTGNSGSSKISISGAGTFYGDTFTVNTAVVSISGSGNVNVYVTNSLKADISGSGTIYYRGNPQVNSKISGSGRVKKI
jgi:hypothetical protein